MIKFCVYVYEIHISMLEICPPKIKNEWRNAVYYLNIATNYDNA